MKNGNGIMVAIIVIAAIAGVAAILVGYFLSGHDIVAWLTSKWAITIYIAVGMIVLMGGVVLIKDAISKL